MKRLTALVALITTFGLNVTAQSPKDQGGSAQQQATQQTIVLSVRGMT